MKAEKRIILYSLSASVVLMLLKFAASAMTHSNAILTDAAESIVNVLASSFAFYSIYLSARPKDENHPYGHGKVEFFSVFLEGGLIFIAGLLIIAKAAYNFFFPEKIENLMEGMGVIAFTGIVNFLLGTYMIHWGRKQHSITIEADGKHLQVDSYSTLGLLVGLLFLYITRIHQVDLFLSLGLGGYILYNGYQLLRKSVAGLMDESDFELINRMADILQKNRKDNWIDIHNLRVQRYGHELHVDCHMTLPNYLNLNQVHQEISETDALINRYVHADTELFIHADPCLPACCSYCRVKNCPIRSEEQDVDLRWDAILLTKNKKHFED